MRVKDFHKINSSGLYDMRTFFSFDKKLFKKYFFWETKGYLKYKIWQLKPFMLSITIHLNWPFKCQELANPKLKVIFSQSAPRFPA